ncbi:GRP family sugar transporter [Levilactobacillus bambusae]|uniref:Glucose transporter GlcU n=1 Tax=Levilactobacillus bambusae TaxID=2024736 RepID=A0A2V1MZQ2_9LACO|nr:GRP family sugar transporter [Levilactobacillus bambusae]PWF99634.1 glucose transporter GlcU [Levilactobacillus bambusae]
MWILLALIPAIGFGSVGIVSGLVGGTTYQQTLGTTTGAFLIGILTLIVWHPELNGKIWLVGIISGLCWTVGQFGQFSAFKYMGVSSAMPFSTGLQLLGNTLAGVLLFSEWQGARMYTLGILALLLLVIGAALTSKRSRDNQEVDPTHDQKKGWTYLLISTVGYVGYTVVIDLGNVPAKSVMFPQSIGMLAGAILFVVFARESIRSAATWKNILTGIVWGIGNCALFIVIPHLGLAVTYAFSQCGVIISTFGGIFILNEHKTRTEMAYVTIGCLLIVVGAVALSFIKA